MNLRCKDTPSVATAKASFSTASAYRIESDPRPPPQKQTPRTRRRSDPLAGIFDKEVVPLLAESPSLRAVTIFDAHYGMRPTRNNRARPIENGSVESAHDHLKRAIVQALLLRDTGAVASVVATDDLGD